MLQSAEKYYRLRQALSVLGLRAARKAWAQVDSNDINGSWAEQLAILVGIVSATQLRAATDATDYIQNSLDEQGIVAPVENGKVVPSAFAAIASDGRSLAGLLDQPRITTLTGLKAGQSIAEALLAGRQSLDRIAVTQIQDAGRVAGGVSVAARPAVEGYVRMLNPPSCSRCVILAGKFYKWNTGFRRHPSCDCFHAPVGGREQLATPLDPEFVNQPRVIDPNEYFKSLTPGEQDKTFGKAGAQALRDGADISQVVNVRQGMDTAGGVKTTTVGTTKHALAGQRLREAFGSRNVSRLMPESIYAMAGNNRQMALDLLHLHGYVL